VVGKSNLLPTVLTMVLLSRDAAGAGPVDGNWFLHGLQLTAGFGAHFVGSATYDSLGGFSDTWEALSVDARFDALTPVLPVLCGDLRIPLPGIVTVHVLASYAWGDADSRPLDNNGELVTLLQKVRIAEVGGGAEASIPVRDRHSVPVRLNVRARFEHVEMRIAEYPRSALLVGGEGVVVQAGSGFGFALGRRNSLEPHMTVSIRTPGAELLPAVGFRWQLAAGQWVGFALTGDYTLTSREATVVASVVVGAQRLQAPARPQNGLEQGMLSGPQPP
jgi:hypothetical protein